MLWVLIRKQFAELTVSIYHDSRKGKRRSRSSVILYMLLFVYVFGMLGFSMYYTGSLMCASLMGEGNTWLFFSVMALMASVLGIIGTAFTAHSTLFNARDNDLLLSMPVPPSYIILSRLIACYLMSFAMESIVHIPTFIVGFVKVGFSVPMLVCDIVLLFVGPVFILAISCILGYLIAFLSSRFKNKSLVTMAVSIVFVGVYLYVYTNLMNNLEMLVVYARKLEDIMGSWLFILRVFGLACLGDFRSLGLFTLLSAGFMFIVFIFIKRSFIRLVTTRKGFAKTAYRTDMVRTSSVHRALLAKEFSKLKSSPGYMLNCSFGTIIMIMASVFLAIKGNGITEMLNGAGIDLSSVSGPIILGALCLVVCMNDLTAPSISLEGKSFWVIRSIPVASKDVLHAKLLMHLILTTLPMMILGLVACFVLRPGLIVSVMILAGGASFSVVTGCIGLLMNLRRPNFNWTNEMAEIKQSLCVLVVLLSGIGIALAVIALAVVLGPSIGGLPVLALLTLVLAGLAMFLFHRVNTRGVSVFESL